MKKKILIGALGLASVFTMISATDGDETGRFWGRGDLVAYGDCQKDSQQADGTWRCACTGVYNYYVLWIGVTTVEAPYYSTSQLGDC